MSRRSCAWARRLVLVEVGDAGLESPSGTDKEPEIWQERVDRLGR